MAASSPTNQPSGLPPRNNLRLVGVWQVGSDEVEMTIPFDELVERITEEQERQRRAAVPDGCKHPNATPISAGFGDALHRWLCSRCGAIVGADGAPIPE